MGNGSVFSRFVLSLKVGYRTLQPLQEPSQSLGVVAPVQRGVGDHLRTIHRLNRQVHQLHRHCRTHRTLEQLPHGLPMPSVEPPQGVVVRMLPPGQPQVRYLVPAGRLQLPARAHPGHEAVQPHAQQRTWMVGWRSQHLPVYLHPKLPPVLPVQSVNELGHESRRMVQRQQFVKRRRQHPYLLSAHLSKWHLNISPIDVASKVHLTTSHCQFGLLRQAQLRTFRWEVSI